MHEIATQSLRIGDRYLVERELGHGGMGIVYQVYDEERGTRLALKTLGKRDASHIYRFKKEFRQLADLSHPNLVSLHELVRDGERWYFTMDLVEGCTFDEYVSRLSSSPSITPEAISADTVPTVHMSNWLTGTLSQRPRRAEPRPRMEANLRRLRVAFRQLVEAIASLHTSGKLHRDIKPSNVLVTHAGRVVVLDFGLVSNATVVEPRNPEAPGTVGGDVFGTPAYMSPEQAEGETVAEASDWYSVGVMLYEALTGRLPFEGSLYSVLTKKQQMDPEPPSELVDGVPDDLDQLCRDLLQRDPKLRPSGAEILRYLTGHSSSRPIFDAQGTAHAQHHDQLFVGRRAQLDELRTAFEATKRGRPAVLFVHGLSGMGKTALVRCFAEQLLNADEAIVLRGRCHEREAVPYKAFDNVIDALSRFLMRLPRDEAASLLPRNIHSLTRLFPVLCSVKAVARARRPKFPTRDAQGLRNEAFAALKELLLRISDYRPIVINIDDLQWADTDSARLLCFLFQPPEPPPLLLVGTYRREEAENSPFLQDILTDSQCFRKHAEFREIAIEALEPREAKHLARSLLGELPTLGGDLVDTVATEAAGIPFFITEFAEHLRARIDLGTPAAALDAVHLDDVLMERARGLPDGAQRLLEILSVAAGPIEQGVALQAAQLPKGDRSAMLSLRAARLIRTRGTRHSDTAETYHDRVRETVVAHMNEAQIRLSHRKLAEAIEAWQVDTPERLVDHYSGAGDGVRAGESAVQAAHAAAEKLAFNRAARLYRRAIELLPEGSTERPDLERHLSEALANADRTADAAQAYLSVAVRGDCGELHESSSCAG
ncbi:MAG: AAA family ATPase [Myxococcales bacterium]|nr:AAA family ATPase [Myxococcales bacterium]